MAVLLALERFDEADKIERTLFSRPQSFSIENATLLEANVRRRAWSLPPDRRMVYLEDALKKGHWSNEARLDLLLVQASCNEGDADKDGKWRATVAKIFRLVDSIGITKLPALLRLDLDEYRLRSLVHMRKLDEARQTYKQMKARYIGKEADWEYICNKQFSWLRAYPQHSQERFNDFQSGAYPTECFQDAVSLTRQVKGASSEEYSLSLLFMAEHEFTKGKIDEARALCKQILDGWTPESSSAFIAARDLNDELDENGHEMAQRKEIIGKQFSKSQVDCLHSIYSSANREKAKERTGKMLEKIREI